MCLWQEIENLVAHLTDHQLDQLEAILAKDLDTDSEFNMLLEGTHSPCTILPQL
jgi:hypothetical protein